MRIPFTFFLFMVVLNVFSQVNIMDRGEIKLPGPLNENIIDNKKTNKPVTIRMRCVASVNNNFPLIIIDGIPVDNKLVNELDPNDIERIDILKSASATAIYGCRASYGVIIITTKGAIDQKFIIRDISSGKKIKGAVVTLKTPRQIITLVSDDSGMIRTDKLRKNRKYEMQVWSPGYKDHTCIFSNDKSGTHVVSMEETSQVSFTIYPNPLPASGTLTVCYSNETDPVRMVRIMNAQGKFLLSQAIQSETSQFSIPTSSKWGAGVYFIQFINAKTQVMETSRVIIQ